MRAGMARLDLERALVAGPGLDPLPSVFAFRRHAHQHPGQITMRLHVVGSKRDRALKGRRGRGELLPLLQRDAQVVVGVGVIGLQFECSAAVGFGLAMAAQVEQHHGQVVVRLGVVGAQANRCLKRRYRLESVAQSATYSAQMMMIKRLSAIEIDRLAEVDRGVVVRTWLVDEQTQQVPRVGLVRIFSQDLAIEPVGAGEVSRPMQRDRAGEQFGELRHDGRRKGGGGIAAYYFAGEAIIQADDSLLIQ